jgi:hypothetical protein
MKARNYNSITTSQVHPIIEYASSCWDPYRTGQINALDPAQNEAAKFAHQRNDLNWETLERRRKRACICDLFIVYTKVRAWKTIRDILQKPCYMSRVNRDTKIRSRKQNKDVRKYSFANMIIQPWNQLPEDTLGTLL